VSDPAAVRVLRRSSGRLRLQLTDATGEPDGLEVALGALKGVREARVSPRTQNLLLTFDPAQIDEGAILAAVTTAAVGAGGPCPPAVAPALAPVAHPDAQTALATAPHRRRPRRDRWSVPASKLGAPRVPGPFASPVRPRGCSCPPHRPVPRPAG